MTKATNRKTVTKAAAKSSPSARTSPNAPGVQEEPGSPPLREVFPLFYQQPLLLRSGEHRQVGVKAAGDYGFAREAIVVPICISEFARAARHYPIVFAAETVPVPLAVLGLEQGQNLFVEPDGSWRAHCYVPAYVRRYPFLLIETPDQAQQMLAVDSGSARYVPDAAESERLFDDKGEPTALAQLAADFCRAWHEDHLNTLTFVKALAKEKLLTPNQAEVQFPDGEQRIVDGFLVADEDTLRARSIGAIGRWYVNGWLDLVTLHLASKMNWEYLLALKAERA